MVDLKIVLPDGFLEEEKRCDFLVTKEIKKVWAVEIDLLCELQRVCKKYGLNYYAYGGTLLGAVRHKGFIPWDDDIDIMMLREDYEKLCLVASNEFENPYFFQTEYSDPGSLRGHAQLRNSKTTAILMEEKGKYRFNQGIFIDIFPLDAVIDNSVKFKKQGRRIEKYKNWYWRFAGATTRKNDTDKYGSIVQFFLSGLSKIFDFERFYYKKMEKKSAQYNNYNTEFLSTLSVSFWEKWCYTPRSDFKETIWGDFEFIKIPMPKEYKHTLSLRYGEDYMIFKKTQTTHGEIFFNTDKPYIEFLSSWQAKEEQL